jgi:valyl-tRNA synthetase
MPFITEEAWQILTEPGKGQSIMLSRQPESGEFDQGLIDRFVFAEEGIIAIRNVRKEKNIPQKEAIRLFIRKNNNEEPDTAFDSLVRKLCNISELAYVEEKVDGCLSFVSGSTEFFIPLAGKIDVAEELLKMQEELAYTTGFLGKVMQKLSNESFVQNAPPAVVDAERKKRDDAASRIRVLEEQIRGLNK